jgi:hypothetical protein
MGKNQFPSYLRSKGYEVNTVADEFGHPDVLDTEWIEAVGKNDWVAFTKDAAIRRVTVERTAIARSKARVVCLVHQQITFTEAVEVFESHWNRIATWFKKPGPWLLAVKKSGVENITLLP